MPARAADRYLRSRWLSRLSRTLIPPAHTATADREAGGSPAGLLPGQDFESLVAELVAVVGDHPDRRALLVAGSVALYRSLLDGVDAELDAQRQAQAADRRRLARDVHDWVGNSVHLALRQLDLHGIESAAGHEGAAARLADARHTLEELSVGTRRLIGELRGQHRGNGLAADLRDYVARANLLGAHVTVEVTGDERALPPWLRDEVFVVVREALRNAFTHAGARHVSASVQVLGGRVRASVEDDGVGMSAAASRPGRGSGLAAMHERVAACGGHIEIGNRRPRGTAVQLVIDVREAVVADAC